MQYIKNFSDLTAQDIPIVGGKNANLGEMISQLGSKGVRIPGGFAVTAEAYRLHLSENNLTDQIAKLVSGLDKNNITQLEQVGQQVRDLITGVALPEVVVEEIKQAYAQLGEGTSVAVRSSATAEDLPEASFAGQQETFLNVVGADALVEASRKCFASLFTNRAISYRIDHGFGHMDVALSVGVQQMVRADKASAGVIFTLDTESGHPGVVLINSAWGLGESIVGGQTDPDELYVHKETLSQGFAPILKKRRGSKLHKTVFSDSHTQLVDTTPDEQRAFSITDEEILELARQALIIEDHYSEKKGSWCPMDIEWAKDEDGTLYIVQARPETVHAPKAGATVLETYELKGTSKELVQGKSIGRSIASGTVRVIASATDMEQLQDGEILVTDMTDPDWEPIMKRAAGIVTNRGGRTCHAAIVSREIGITAIVGAAGATQALTTGQQVTLDCSSSEVGTVYEGELEFEVHKTQIDKLPELQVQIMMNVGNPSAALGAAMLPNDGVGLARMEFIIASAIKVHPMALVHLDKVTQQADKEQLEEITHGYKDKKQFFVDTLAHEAGTIAAAFFPKPVILRLSDLKSNEYRSLVAGSYFEPEEENPMLGFRGASRYTHENYREAFALECAAVKKMRDEMGLVNLAIMVPFVRTVGEAKAVLAELRKHGLERGHDGIEIYMMCEVPSNVMLIEEFAQMFDGISIGSNDLTQLTLGLDRDSAVVAGLFDERDPAVKKMLSMAIAGAKKAGKYVGICGQAPSDYPEIARFLVDEGIDSISLNPDTVVKTIIELGGRSAK